LKHVRSAVARFNCTTEITVKTKNQIAEVFRFPTIERLKLDSGKMLRPA
jgi:hypothetical protein